MVGRGVLVVCLLLSSVAWAEKLSPKAQELYNQGKLSYDVGEFDAAVAKWKEGYKISSEPVFLYNIAQAYRHAGNINQAIFFYRSYLRNAPDAVNRKIAEERIAELERLQAQEPKDPGKEAPTNVPASAPVVTPPLISEPAPPSPGRAQRIAGLATAGAGAVLAGVGAYLLVDAGGRSDDLEAAADAHETWTAATADDVEAIDAQNTLGGVVTVVGVAAIVGGAALYYLGRKAGREVAVVPVVGAEGASLTLAMEF